MPWLGETAILLVNKPRRTRRPKTGWPWNAIINFNFCVCVRSIHEVFLIFNREALYNPIYLEKKRKKKKKGERTEIYIYIYIYIWDVHRNMFEIIAVVQLIVWHFHRFLYHKLCTIPYTTNKKLTPICFYFFSSQERQTWLSCYMTIVGHVSLISL